jgi:hypothetical protein
LEPVKREREGSNKEIRDMGTIVGPPTANGSLAKAVVTTAGITKF